MKNPFPWGSVEPTIYDETKAGDKDQESGIVGLSSQAASAGALRRAGLLHESVVEKLLETSPQEVAEEALRGAIARLSVECTPKQLEFLRQVYPSVEKSNLDGVYKLLVRTVRMNRQNG